MRAVSRFLLCVAMLAPLSAGSRLVAAEQPSPVIEALAADGVFVHSRRAAGVDRDALAAVVDEAEALGYRMAIVVPLEPLPDLRAFVLRIQQGGEFDIVLGYGSEGEIEASTSDSFDNSDRLSALGATRDAGGDAEVLAARFLDELTTDPPNDVPGTVKTIIRWVVLLVIALGVTITIEQLWRSRSRRGQAQVNDQAGPLA